MQFDVAKTVLLKAISNVNGAVEKKNTIPVLQNIKIEAKDEKVILSATDMDILVTSTFEAGMKTGGSTTVPAQMFFDIIRKIPDQNIERHLYLPQKTAGLYKFQRRRNNHKDSFENAKSFCPVFFGQ